VSKRRTGDKHTPAEEGVLFCNKLFELERKFADMHLILEKRSVWNSQYLFWMPFGTGSKNKIHHQDPISTKQ